jgi:capsular exopolysaccharide synthesis family protein
MSVLIGRSTLADSIQIHSSSGVHILVSGPIPPNPTEVLESQAAKKLFRELGELYDIVIIDAPPLLPVSDAAIVASEVDGALLVVRHGRTDSDQLALARERLENVGAKLLGAVLNGTPRQQSAHEYGYGYSTYGPDRGADDRKAATGGRKSLRRTRAGSRKRTL